MHAKSYWDYVIEERLKNKMKMNFGQCRISNKFCNYIVHNISEFMCTKSQYSDTHNTSKLKQVHLGKYRAQGSKETMVRGPTICPGRFLCKNLLKDHTN